MDIQTASMNMSQARLQEQAAIQVEAMGLSAMEQQGAALEKLMESAVIDPTLGNTIDISA